MDELWAGPYRLESVIARGGFGVVARATHAPTGRAAAVKVMHAELFADPTAIPRFEREAAIACDLPHPNVVRVHEIGRLSQNAGGGLQEKRRERTLVRADELRVGAVDADRAR